ncbi:gamma-glutamyl-gamma-aminobutyrate hydrolase family protein [Paenibacillus hodogayensis]|uniref:Gamma-glutamyl-gamma-aminobutyrate hydrolase family protein n=1 Tax=Paenibacillus hodogayensis TaxID=279208 RepID=A0ABV5W5I4_9BACL
MKPIIAISANYEDEYAGLKHAYADAVLQAGGIPVIVPFGLGEAEVRGLCAVTSGLLLSGGPDVDPSYYGEEPLPGLGRVTPERDRLELLLVREYAGCGKPIFAICRGQQVLNVALGGSLYQDIYSQCRPLQHSQKAPRNHLSHRVRAQGDSRVATIAGATEFKVNSFHHQSVKQPAPDMRITASAEDGIVEAIESTAHPFVIGVQWHPEDTAASDDVSRKLFEAFVAACR